MRTFVYRAKHGPVRIVEGELAAESHAAALAALDARGYTPIWIREQEAEPRRRAFWRGSRITTRDITILTRQLGSLIRAGVPILRALSTVSEQTDKGRLRRVIQDIQSTVRDGGMLSDALVKFPALFSELYVNMVRAGESAGVLETILQRLSDAREQEEDTRRKVQGALAYPVLVLSVGLMTVFVLLAFFLPRVASLFQEYRQLPLPTRALIATSRFFEVYWPWMASLAVLAVAVFHRLAAMEKGRAVVDRLRLAIPLLGQFVRLADISRFARTLSLLLGAGIPIDKALALGTATMRNAVFREELETVRRETVEQGQPLSAGLKRAAHIPTFVANMVAVGEESGHLEESLAEVAAFYEKEFEQLSRLATSLLEPSLILVVGGIVGFIVSAMLLPIFRIGMLR
jgi:type II secretory pathway component PulF